jgi:hypothetical protein
MSAYQDLLDALEQVAGLTDDQAAQRQLAIALMNAENARRIASAIGGLANCVEDLGRRVS